MEARSLVTRVLVGLCAALACVGAHAAGCAAPERSDYVDGQATDRTGVVVFVHGVLSNLQSAWTADNGVYWPCLLRRESVFDNSNIYAYQYPTEALGASPSIDQVGLQLLQDLGSARVFAQHAHVVIVAHSMGGLVVSSLLAQMRDHAEFRDLVPRVRLVMFYGTPGTGADIASVADWFSGNVQFKEMSARTEPTAQVQRWHAPPAWPFRWFCVGETRRTGWWLGIGTRVVTADSARELCRLRGQASWFDVDADHVQLVKPISLGSVPHLLLKRHFESCAAKAIRRAQPDSRIATPPGQAVAGLLGTVRRALTDPDSVGAIPVGARALVESLLHQDANGSDPGHYSARDASRPASGLAMLERQPASIFAHEFVKSFVAEPGALQPEWVGPVSDSRRLVADGEYSETLATWGQAGDVAVDDWVAALPVRGRRGRPLVVMSMTAGPGGTTARIRHLVTIPEPSPVCP